MDTHERLNADAIVGRSSRKRHKDAIIIATLLAVTALVALAGCPYGSHYGRSYYYPGYYPHGYFTGGAYHGYYYGSHHSIGHSGFGHGGGFGGGGRGH